MSRFYKTTKTPTVDYQYTYPFQELFQSMKYKRARNDKALEQIQAGYDKLTGLNYIPEDRYKIEEMNNQFNEFMDTLPSDLSNANGYIQKFINNSVNTQFTNDIATNYKNYMNGLRMEAELRAKGQWRDDMRSDDYGISTEEGGIMNYFPKAYTDYKPFAKTYFDDVDKSRRTEEGLNEVARQGAIGFWQQPKGNMAIRTVYGNEAVDNAIKNNDIDALEEMSYNILKQASQEFVLDPLVAAGGTTGSTTTTDLGPTDPYGDFLIKSMTTPGDVNLDFDQEMTISKFTDKESMYDIPNSVGVQTDQNNFTIYNNLGLLGDVGLTWDKSTSSWITDPNSNLESSMEQRLLVNKLNKFYESDRAKSKMSNVVESVNRNKFLQEFKNTDTYKNIIKLNELGAPEKGTTIFGEEYNKTGKSTTISLSDLKKLYPNTWSQKKGPLENQIIKISQEDLQEGGKFEDLMERFKEGPVEIIQNPFVSDDTEPGRRYNNSITELRQFGVINPFDKKWIELVKSYNPKTAKGISAEKLQLINKQIREFNVRASQGIEGDWTPSGRGTLITKNVNGKPVLHHVRKGYYTLDAEGVNKLFSNDLRLDPSDVVGYLNASDYKNVNNFHDSWAEIFLKGTGDKDHLADIIEISPHTYTIGEGDNAIEMPLFRVPATYEIPVDESGLTFNIKHGGFKSGQANQYEKAFQAQRLKDRLKFISDKAGEMNNKLWNNQVDIVKDRFNSWLVEPRNSGEGGKDVRPEFVEKMFNGLGRGNSLKGTERILNEVYPSPEPPRINTDPIYTEMNEILSDYKTDINTYINATNAGNATVLQKEEYEQAINNMSGLTAQLNPDFWGGEKPLTVSEIKSVFRKHINKNNQVTGKPIMKEAYMLDEKGTNKSIGIIGKQITNPGLLRSASREYFENNPDFTQVSVNNLPPNIKFSGVPVYAPYLNNTTFNSLLSLGNLAKNRGQGDIIITGLSRIPGYDKILGGGNGNHTRGKAVDVHPNEFTHWLAKQSKSAKGLEFLKSIGIQNVYDEVESKNHYHINFL